MVTFIVHIRLLIMFTSFMAQCTLILVLFLPTCACTHYVNLKISTTTDVILQLTHARRKSVEIQVARIWKTKYLISWMISKPNNRIDPKCSWIGSSAMIRRIKLLSPQNVGWNLRSAGLFGGGLLKSLTLLSRPKFQSSPLLMQWPPMTMRNALSVVLIRLLCN